MKARKRKKPVEESAYSMLVNSQEAKRGYLETIVYALVIGSAVAAILQFAIQRDPGQLAGMAGSIPPV
jgi:hypothetical protein